MTHGRDTGGEELAISRLPAYRRLRRDLLSFRNYGPILRQGATCDERLDGEARAGCFGALFGGEGCRWRAEGARDVAWRYGGCGVWDGGDGHCDGHGEGGCAGGWVVCVGDVAGGEREGVVVFLFCGLLVEGWAGVVQGRMDEVYTQ